jgi:hypothetical protein
MPLQAQKNAPAARISAIVLEAGTKAKKAWLNCGSTVRLLEKTHAACAAETPLDLGLQQGRLTPWRSSVGCFPGDGDAAGADQLFDAERAKHIDHRLDFLHIAGDFDRIGIGRRIDDLGAKNIRQPNRLIAISAVSRSRKWVSVRSTTLSTSTTLLSCFMICSMIRSSPTVTMVIIDVVGSRVGATDKLSML